MVYYVGIWGSSYKNSKQPKKWLEPGAYIPFLQRIMNLQKNDKKKVDSVRLLGVANCEKVNI